MQCYTWCDAVRIGREPTHMPYLWKGSILREVILLGTIRHTQPRSHTDVTTAVRHLLKDGVLIGTNGHTLARSRTNVTSAVRRFLEHTVLFSINEYTRAWSRTNVAIAVSRFLIEGILFGTDIIYTHASNRTDVTTAEKRYLDPDFLSAIHEYTHGICRSGVTIVKSRMVNVNTFWHKQKDSGGRALYLWPLRLYVHTYVKRGTGVQHIQTHSW